MNDQTTTVSQLKSCVEEFVAARDWRRFHSPKNLAMSLSIETAELMEHFQWLTPEQSREVIDRPEVLSEVADEMADVLCYVLALANELRIDLSTAMREKMVKNEGKYPADEYRGRFGRSDPGA
jgi:NTP pyrophosphatase (non-canonical NTP hydrolase)